MMCGCWVHVVQLTDTYLAPGYLRRGYVLVVGGYPALRRLHMVAGVCNIVTEHHVSSFVTAPGVRSRGGGQKSKRK
jgi:hypothetical protein